MIAEVRIITIPSRRLRAETVRGPAELLLDASGELVEEPAL